MHAYSSSKTAAVFLAAAITTGSYILLGIDTAVFLAHGETYLDPITGMLLIATPLLAIMAAIWAAPEWKALLLVAFAGAVFGTLVITLWAASEIDAGIIGVVSTLLGTLPYTIFAGVVLAIAFFIGVGIGLACRWAIKRVKVAR